MSKTIEPTKQNRSWQTSNLSRTTMGPLSPSANLELTHKFQILLFADRASQYIYLSN